MKFLKNNWEFIGFALLIISFYVGVVYSYSRESQECDLVVFVKDELSIDANRVNHYSNGFTTVELCDGKRLVYRSDLIIKVVEK